jgi:hypothetical protein
VRFSHTACDSPNATMSRRRFTACLIVHPRRLVLNLITGALVFSVLGAAQTCYHLDGSTMDSSQNSPCLTNATGKAGSHSTCCNYKNADACLASGLCLNTLAVQPSHLLWSSGCTDPTGKDASCPKLCTGGRPHLFHRPRLRTAVQKRWIVRRQYAYHDVHD